MPLSAACSQAGLVLQDPSSQFATLTVWDEACFGPENLGLPPEEVQRRGHDALDRLGLLGLEARRPDQLSGGQQQRLALASTLAMGPRLLLLDEPTANLDPAAAGDLLSDLGRLAEECCVLLVEHRAHHALPQADHVVALTSTGGLLAQGPPEDVLVCAGDSLLDAGLWLPAASELALRLRADGGWPGPLPLSVEDLAAALAGPLLSSHAGWSPAPTDSSSPGDVALHAADLWYSYPGSPPALRGAGLKLRRGAVTGLAGPNGAGKSTLALCLLGFLRPSQGFISGAATRLPGSLGVSMVFQNPEHQLLAATVEDELAAGLRGRGLPEAAVKARVEEALKRYRFMDVRRRHPYRLSWGQKRRLSLASVLLLEPEVLVLDEPTFGQDRAGAQAILDQIRALAGSGVSVLMISHDVDQLLSTVDDLAILLDGRIVAQGDPWDLMADASLRERASLALPFSMRLHTLLADHRWDVPRLRRQSDWRRYLSGRAPIR
jgi:energy-coupling factor transport system ATP-binding protein